MTGKTQSDAVKILRLIPEGSHVELVISRQEEVDEKFKVPRKMVFFIVFIYINMELCVEQRLAFLFDTSLWEQRLD